MFQAHFKQLPSRFQKISRLFPCTFKTCPETYQEPFKYLPDTFPWFSILLPDTEHLMKHPKETLKTCFKHLQGTLHKLSRCFSDNLPTSSRHPLDILHVPYRHTPYTLYGIWMVLSPKAVGGCGVPPRYVYSQPLFGPTSKLKLCKISNTVEIPNWTSLWQKQ